jgi:hypothetical protein
VGALRAELQALRAEAAEPAEVEPPLTVPAVEEVAEDDTKIAEAEAVAAREPDVGEAASPADAEPAVAPEPATAPPEGARLLALKMALDGRSRDETAAYLRENFELDDPEALLDEVYAQVDS